MDTSFKNELILPIDLPAYEDLKLESPDPKYWKVIVINLCIVGFILAIGIGCLFFFTELVLLVLIGLSAIISLIYLGICFLYKKSFAKRGYALREKDIVYKSGVIVEKTIVVPINRIQHIAVEEGFILRYYQLASLLVYTAAIHGSPLTLRGLPKEIAFQLKSELLNQAHQTSLPDNSSPDNS